MYFNLTSSTPSLAHTSYTFTTSVARSRIGIRFHSQRAELVLSVSSHLNNQSAVAEVSQHRSWEARQSQPRPR